MRKVSFQELNRRDTAWFLIDYNSTWFGLYMLWCMNGGQPVYGIGFVIE